VKPYPGNPGVAADIIHKTGICNPIYVDGRGVVISGHARLAAVREPGMTEISVIACDCLSADHVHTLCLADSCPPAGGSRPGASATGG